jgi:hypothetical protein
MYAGTQSLVLHKCRVNFVVGIGVKYRQHLFVNKDLGHNCTKRNTSTSN